MKTRLFLAGSLAVVMLLVTLLGVNAGQLPSATLPFTVEVFLDSTATTTWEYIPSFGGEGHFVWDFNVVCHDNGEFAQASMDISSANWQVQEEQWSYENEEFGWFNDTGEEAGTATLHWEGFTAGAHNRRAYLDIDVADEN